MSVCLGGGGGRSKINAVELRWAAGGLGRGRGVRGGRSPGGRRASSSFIQRPLWVPSKPSHAQAPTASPPPWLSSNLEPRP